MTFKLSEDLGKQPPILQWRLSPLHSHLLKELSEQLVNLLIHVSWPLPLSIKSSQNRPHSHFTPFHFEGSPSRTFLIFKSMHSTETITKPSQERAALACSYRISCVFTFHGYHVPLLGKDGNSLKISVSLCDILPQSDCKET